VSPAVRTAAAADADVTVATVVAAFADDPAWRFFFGDDYGSAAPHLARALFEARLPGGSVWVADDGASVAVWEPVGGVDLDAESVGGIWGRCRQAVGDGAWARLRTYDAAVHAVGPPPDAWYLGVLATRPADQGRGLASAVLAPVLASADAAGTTCCLETSNPDNLAYYRGHGFEVAAPVDVEGGPPTWWLERPARG
jgi:GNAT superfamily N-acetyltransferase